MGIISPCQPALHHLIEQADILCEGRCELIACAAFVRHCDRPDEFAIIQSIFHFCIEPGSKMGVFDAFPETEEIRHSVDQRRRLRPEQNGESTDRIPAAFVKLDFIFDRRAVLVFQ